MKIFLDSFTKSNLVKPESKRPWTANFAD